MRCCGLCDGRKHVVIGLAKASNCKRDGVFQYGLCLQVWQFTDCVVQLSKVISVRNCNEDCEKTACTWRLYIVGCAIALQRIDVKRRHMIWWEFHWASQGRAGEACKKLQSFCDTHVATMVPSRNRRRGVSKTTHTLQSMETVCLLARGNSLTFGICQSALNLATCSGNLALSAKFC